MLDIDIFGGIWLWFTVLAEYVQLIRVVFAHLEMVIVDTLRISKCSDSVLLFFIEFIFSLGGWVQNIATDFDIDTL